MNVLGLYEGYFLIHDKNSILLPQVYSVSHVTTLSNHFTKSRIYAKYTKLVSNAHPSIMKSFRTNVLLMSINSLHKMFGD